MPAYSLAVETSDRVHPAGQTIGELVVAFVRAQRLKLYGPDFIRPVIRRVGFRSEGSRLPHHMSVELSGRRFMGR